MRTRSLSFALVVTLGGTFAQASAASNEFESAVGGPWQMPAPIPMADTLASGATLGAGQSLTSGDYTLKMQTNGILRLTQTSTSDVLWSQGIINHNLAVATMQTNGDLQIVWHGHVDWDSATPNHDDSRLVLLSTGRLVIYDPSNTPIGSAP
jgi:hypothetical protein